MESKGVTLSATGHRPDKLGGYGLAARERLDRYALQCLRELSPRKVISGFALGWDQSIARAAVALRIPLVAALPFYCQAIKWPAESQREWSRLLALCAEVVIVSPGGFTNAKMHERNAWMVDHSDALLALWNGSPGGTSACVAYAKRQPHIRIIEAWPGFQTCN